MFYTNARVWGNQIQYRYVNDRGERKNEKVQFKPKLFVPAKTTTPYKTIFDKPVSVVDFDSIKEAKQFVETYQDVGNFEIFGNTGWVYQFLGEAYPGIVQHDASKIRISYLDIEVNSSNGFPEPDVAKEEVTAITVSYQGILHTYGTKDYTVTMPDHVYHQCKNEYELLRAFLKRWSLEQPDAVSGWHIAGFDIPYLVNRITKIVGEEQVKALSPWGAIRERTSRTKIQSNYVETKTYELAGISILDYMMAYKKFVLAPRESYSLHFISQLELGDTKIEYDAELGLHGLYETDYQKFIEYNAKDVELVMRLDKKLNLMALIQFLAYNAKVNFEDTLSQVRMWDALIYNKLKAKGVVVPFKRDSHKDAKYEGAYVKDPQIGFHRDLISFDFGSLYPSLFMTYNVGPETLVPYHKLPDEVKEWLIGKTINVETLLERKYDMSVLVEHNLTLTPNGEFFRTDITSFMAEIVRDMAAARKEAKAEMLRLEQILENTTDEVECRRLESLISTLDIKQQGIKVTMNSMYGAAGNEYFRFYDLRIAQAITLSGQLALRWVEKDINNWMNTVAVPVPVEQHKDYVVYGDTDSNYLTIHELMKRISNGREFKDITTKINLMDKIAKEQIQPVITNSTTGLCVYLNAKTNQLIMKREAIADTGIWSGKKRYMLNVWDSEGVRYNEAKVKVKGIEIVRSSTPQIVRDELKKAVKVMLSGGVEELREHATLFRKKFMEQEPAVIAFPRSVNGVAEYQTGHGTYAKGTPIGPKAAIIYNKILKDKGLQTKYKSIGDGEKVKFVYLKEPNPLLESVIAFRGNLPKEFDLDKYVDYALQFEKTFLDPLESLLEVIGWELEEKATLDEFFS